MRRRQFDPKSLAQTWHAKLTCRRAQRRTAPDPETCDVPSMLSPAELALLHLSARHEVRGEGNIVELGAYLGGSTVALARGLRENRRARSTTMIETFDRFDHKKNVVHGVAADSDTQAMWESNVASYRDTIELHAGDLREYRRPPKARPVELLFVDIVKHPAVIQPVMSEFHPALIPGRSVVIHQDYFHWASPWVVYATEALADHLVPVAVVASSSAVFKCVRAIPTQLATLDWVNGLSTDEKLDLMRTSANRHRPKLRASIELSMARLVADSDRAEALRMVDAVAAANPDQPRVLRHAARLRRYCRAERGPHHEPIAPT